MQVDYSKLLDSNGHHPGWKTVPVEAQTGTAEIPFTRVVASHPPSPTLHDKSIQQSKCPEYVKSIDHEGSQTVETPLPVSYATQPVGKPNTAWKSFNTPRDSGNASDVPSFHQDRPPNRFRPPGQADRPRPGHGEYGFRTIAHRLGATDAHSFYVQAVQPASDCSPSEEPEKIAAIVYHRDANIPTTLSPSTFEIWTRHNFASILNQINDPLPFFHYSDSEASQTLWTRFHSSFYSYVGQYSIQSAEIIKGGSPEVRAFIEKREESKRKRTAEKWRAMLQEDWMKVTIVRASEEVQKERTNPMDTRSSEMDRSRSGTDPSHNG